MALMTWAWLLDGKHVTAPGGVGGQCVDLANLWLEDRGIPLVRLNAADWAGRTLAGLVWVPNGKVNFPEAGALVVWRANGGHGIGPMGHIAVNVYADGMALASLDQNWPDGAPVGLVLHDYVGVAGWHLLDGAARS